MRITWRDRFPSSMLAEPEELERHYGKLKEIVFTIKPKVGGYVDASEVYPNLYIGNGERARDLKFMKKTGITHVVNTACGDRFGFVNTSAEFYKKKGIQFLGLTLTDLPSVKISDHFDEVADFIESALANKKNKVYVHCLMGISRSATMVLAFLMLKRGMTAEEALIQVRSCRNVIPNEGFLKQLAVLDLKLKGRKGLSP